MKTDTFVYTGCENLEAMTEAVNYNKFLIDLVLKQLGPKNRTKVRILDFGAGSGTYAKLLKDHDIIVDCLEPDETLQKELKKNGFKVFTDINKVPADTYDLIYALNVFEHIEDDFAEVRKLRNVLKKSGRLLIYVPAYQLLYSSMDKLVGHHRRYRTGRLKKMANQAQLKINTVLYYDPVGFWAALTYKVIRGKGVLSAGSVRTYDKYAFPFSKSLHPITKRIIGKNAILVAEK